MPNADWELRRAKEHLGQVLSFSRFKYSNGYTSGRVYIPKSIRSALKWPSYGPCYTYVQGDALMITFCEAPSPEDGHRVMYNGFLKLPDKSMLSQYMSEGEHKSIPAAIRDGNILVNLADLRDKDENKRVRQKTEGKLR